MRAVRLTRRLVFASFGVPLSISYPRDLEESLQPILPPARDRMRATMVPRQVLVERHGNALLRATVDDGAFIAEGDDPGFVFDILDTFIRGHIASTAPQHVFVHAGAVAVDGVALVLPGPALVGKSTLVAALVRAGAAYLSDEFAVMDPGGNVIAYPRMISLRAPGAGPSTEVDPRSLGRVATADPHPVGFVVLTGYRPGMRWNPDSLTPGIAALRVFEHAVTAATRPEESLSVIRRALEGAVVLEGPRGEADELAPPLIAELRALASTRA